MNLRPANDLRLRCFDYVDLESKEKKSVTKPANAINIIIKMKLSLS